MTREQIEKAISELRTLDKNKNAGNGVVGWVFYKNRLTELALPVIDGLERQLQEAQAEIERINANAEQDRDECDAYRRERDALQAELSGLKADMFVLNNDLGYTTGVLEDVLKQRDALQARVDGALDVLSVWFDGQHSIGDIERILTGEGE